MKLNWIFLVLTPPDDEDKSEVLHICAYEHEPTEVDEQSLRAELATDEEFGLVGFTGYLIVKHSREEYPEIFGDLVLPDEINDDEIDENASCDPNPE
jgi:hypothetical protein